MKRKIQKSLIVFIMTLLIILGINIKVFATENGIIGFEYSDAYLEWLKLDDEQKNNSIMPRMYKVRKDMSSPINPIMAANLVGASLESKFDLNSSIRENLVIKNQGKFGACWSFASLGALETNLAMRDYQNQRAAKVYDFSEMHMIYATSTSFNNNKKPDIAFERRANTGSNIKLAMAYLTNGTGPIEEKYMKYDDTVSNIDISTIQNKTVAAQICDTYEFPSTETMSKDELQLLMKSYIKNNGGIYSTIHESGEPGGSTASGECPNPDTGAIYCNDSKTHSTNHAVLIVGWDDNYSVDNFTEGYRPSNKGAWIARDSHGDDASHTYTFDDLKKINFEANKEAYLKDGLTDYTKISDEFIIKQFEDKKEYSIDREKRTIYLKHNDNGYLYISYEDANIYTLLMGISKVSTDVNYENIYQHDEFGIIGTLGLKGNKYYTANVFDKKTEGTEYITKIALETSETVTCKVYINPRNDDIGEENLRKVTLKEGTTVTLNAGYHVLEFADPVQITGNEFMVIVEFQGKRNDGINISLSYNSYDYYKKVYGTEPPEAYAVYKNVEVSRGECFFSIDDKALSTTTVWNDLAAISEQENSLADSASSIKAFTVSKLEEPTPTPPVSPGPTVTPTPTPSPTPDPEDGEPKNTDLSKANCVVTSVKYYTFSDPSVEEYSIIGMAIDNISRAKGNDSLEYYYYISENPNETNITDWIKIKEEQKADNKILFDVKTTDIKNSEELSEVEKFYVYIKEVAKKGEDTSTEISKGLEVNSNIDISEVEIYLDNVKIKNSQEPSNPDKPTDDPTVSKNKLPYTGVKTIIIFIMLGVIIFGLYEYIRYRILKKYIK